ncbi:MAG TPA: hypothetical protein VG842_02890 [Sediminibacterium sp.]|nr:hypothetical protein [Sediminibacterium sp.]
MADTKKRKNLLQQMAPDFSQKNELWLHSQDKLRKLVGILGMLLPLLLFVFLWVDMGYMQPLPSISHYYFTRVCGIFILVVGLLGFSLVVYKGWEKEDFFISLAAGVSALLLLLFPTDNLGTDCNQDFSKVYVTILRTSKIRPGFHYACAAIFLGCLAYMSFFLFTKSDLPAGKRPARKVTRNRIYRSCAIVMVFAMMVIISGLAGIIPENWYTQHSVTFWMETLAIEAFGFSWMVKGRSFLKDR